MRNAVRLFDAAFALARRATSFFLYVPLLALSSVVTLAKLLVYARMTSPEEYGAISQMFLIGNTFAAFGSLGFYLLGQRELPALHIRGRIGEMAVLEAQALLVTSLSAASVLVLSLVSLLVNPSPPMIGQFGVAVALLYGWAQACFSILNLDARSRLLMMRHASDLLVRASGVAVVGAVVLLLGYHSRSVVLSEAAITFVLTSWLARNTIVQTKASTLSVLKQAARLLPVAQWYSSFTLVFSSLLSFLSLSLDRWAAALLLDLAHFGYYSFAWTPVAVGQALQYLVGASVTPLIARQGVVSTYGSFRLAALFSFSFALGGLGCASILEPFINPAIRTWFPQQTGAGDLVEPLFIAAVFRVADFWSTFLIVIKREVLLVVTQAVLLCAVIGSLGVFVLATGAAPAAHTIAVAAAGMAVANFAACGGAAWFNRGAR